MPSCSITVFDRLEQDGDRVLAYFSNRTSYETPALIGADGGASTVRNVYSPIREQFTTPYLGQGACMAIEDGMILGRSFAVSRNLAEAFSRYQAARRDRANGVQLAARYQGTQHHGSTASGPGSGKTAATLGLFSYNPVTEPI